jgi:phosphinothricin acetyltransferase
MQIRAATEEDLPEVSAIYDHHAVSSVSTFDDETPGPGRWLPKVGDDRVNGEHLLVVVADDGEVRGYAESSVFRARPAYEYTREVSVYLGLDARQQGYGRKLYDELLGRLRADGVHQVLAVIALPNDASVRMHERSGFAHVGTMLEVGDKQDRMIDVGIYQRML